MKYFFCLIPCLVILGGCAQQSSQSAGMGTNQVTQVTQVTQAEPERKPEKRSAQSMQEDIRYYISKLPDREYVETYGGEEHPKTWYIAAEALGWIGKPAVPHLITRLDSNDSYEVMLALYALQLASQDPDITWQTDGEYIRLRSVLTADQNAQNIEIAKDWWRRHGHLWE